MSMEMEGGMGGWSMEGGIVRGKGREMGKGK